MSILSTSHLLREEAGAEGAGGGSGGDESGSGGEGGDGGDADWTASLPEDLRGYVGNKGFRSPDAVVESYRNLEKLVNVPEDRLLKLPEGDDSEGWGKIYNKLGRPTDPKEYDLGEAVTDENFGEWYKETAHGLGLTQEQARQFVDKMVERGNELQAETTMDAQEQAKETERELRTEWGAAYDQNVALVDRAAEELGMTKEQLGGLRDSMGSAEAFRFLYGLAQKMGEDNFVDGGDGTGGKGSLGAMTPEAAKARIKDLGKDVEFVNRFQKGDVKAKEEWSKLHRWAYPE